MRSKVCLGIAVSLFAVWSGSAVAAPVDAASDHVALRAYDRYLRAVVSTVPAARQSADAFVASIAASCPNVLADSGLRQTGLTSGAGAAFALEIAGDIAVKASGPYRAPLAHLKRVLSRLRWSSKRTTATVTRFLAAEHGLINLAPSGLCADASALAANPQVTPPRTAQWLTVFRPAVDAASAGNKALVKTLSRISIAANGPVIKEIVGLSKRIRSAAATLATAETPKLFTALGVSP